MFNVEKENCCLLYLWNLLTAISNYFSIGKINLYKEKTENLCVVMKKFWEKKWIKKKSN